MPNALLIYERIMPGTDLGATIVCFICRLEEEKKTWGRSMKK